MKKRILPLLLGVSLLLSSCAAGSGNTAKATPEVTAAPVMTATPEPTSAVKPDVERTTMSGFYFDTVVTAQFYGAPAGFNETVHHACSRYENLLSKTVPGSDVWNINHADGQPVKVDPETWHIIRRAKEVSTLTGHAFSITIAPLTEMWDFTGGTQRMPTDEARIAALPLVDDDAIILGEDYTVQLKPGMQIDLGGIAKGYIADKIAELCRDVGIPALLNFGGNVYAEGVKPDNSVWRVGMKDPANPDGNPLLIVNVKDRTVVTSGSYERYFIKDGVLYHHILDPKTGMPAETDLTSVTIIGTSSMDCDAFATAAIVLGKEKATEMLEANGLTCVLIDKENHYTMTENFGYEWREYPR